MINIGICGLGFVGNAIYNVLINHNNLDLLVYDKYKNINSFETVLNSDILFICLPTNYCSINKTYDMNAVDETIMNLNSEKYQGVIVIKSTVLPDYCLNQNNKYPDLKIINNPEFLSAKTAIEDFKNQKHIILGYTTQSKDYVNYVSDFYRSVFPDPNLNISITNSVESSLTKLACNSFYATKIQYFTEIFLLCQKLNISYDNIKNMMLENGWINPMHTTVPGHDNNISFGGACFPKDISALNEYFKKLEMPNDVINSVIIERNNMRSD
jgi:nucleotide sugar dehydrogenase